MRKNIVFVILKELLLFMVIFMMSILMSGQSMAVSCFVDSPSLSFILLFLIAGLIIIKEWNHFIKAFSVGIKPYTMGELKCILKAVDAAQKLSLLGAFAAIAIHGIFLVNSLEMLSFVGSDMAKMFLSGFYGTIISFILLPLKLNVEHIMNEEMDYTE